MRFITSATSAIVAVAFFSGCAGGIQTTNPSLVGAGAQSRTGPISVYDDAPPGFVQTLHAVASPDKTKATAGIYVSSFSGTSIYGYPPNNKANKPPICTITGVASPNGIAVDGKGNLVEPDGGGRSVQIFKGPTMCGPLTDTISDPYGQPSDASSPDALTGTIAVGNIVDTGTQITGSLSICTVAGGCTKNFTRPEIYHAGGVAMSNSGDCWLSVKTSASGGAELVYWKKCTGKGVKAKGFKNTYYGGLEIDNKGHLLSIDYTAQNLYIYSGCNPTCKLVSGPFPLKNATFFGKLNKANTDFAGVDRTNGAVDVYSFSETKVKYLYSFNNGLTLSQAPEGIAQNPRSKQ